MKDISFSEGKLHVGASWYRLSKINDVVVKKSWGVGKILYDSLLAVLFFGILYGRGHLYWLWVTLPIYLGLKALITARTRYLRVFVCMDSGRFEVAKIMGANLPLHGFSLEFRNGSSFAIVARDGVQLSLIASGFSGVPAGHGRCYCKLSSGIDALYSDYSAKGVSIRHELRDESYSMREFMIADFDQNEINFGQRIQ